jgi:hypothetical protein
MKGILSRCGQAADPPASKALVNRRQPLFFLIFAVAAIVSGALPSGSIEGQESASIRGRVVDGQTLAPLASAMVMIQGTDLGTLTAEDGSYRISGLGPGSYVLVFQVIGYETFTRPDVILAPGRSTQVNVELQVSAVEVEGIVVDAGYFPKDDRQPVSNVRFYSEEVRRAPGSAGDVSRVLLALPSTAQIADNANDLFVRGGSPLENGFFIDDIAVPNINHFPTQGATGGPIGMANVEFIEDVDFSSGGFSAAYGDRLSSIVDIDFREGSTDEMETRVEMSMSGVGGVVEGPLPGGRGSWFLSGRRSFLDLIVDAIGTGVAPRYGDIHAKATFEPADNHRISLLALFGDSEIAFNEAESVEEAVPYFGEYAGQQGTVGLSWRGLWGSRGYSVVALSTSSQDADDLWHRTATGDLIATDHSFERVSRLRNVNRLSVGGGHTVDFGGEVELLAADYDLQFGAQLDRLGGSVPAHQIVRDYDDRRLGLFASSAWRLTPRWSLTTGVRADRYSQARRTVLSPRIASSLTIRDGTTMNAAAGVFYQRLPSYILAQNPSFEELGMPRALHFVVGVDQLLSPSAQLTVEAYLKEYDSFPLEEEDPTLFVVDDGTSQSSFRSYRTLVAEGRARSYGIEVLLQKRLAEDFYGQIGASGFSSRYRDLDGSWRPRIHDNRFLLNVVGGYKPSHGWELSGRWSVAGGAPYTPFDATASRALNSGIIDASAVHAERYPAYHALNLRLDRRSVFRGSALTTSLSLWNVYGHQNVSAFYWNEVDNQLGTAYQWGFFPVLAMEWEF